MSQAMQNEIDELRGRVYALEQSNKTLWEWKDRSVAILEQLEPAMAFLTPEVLAEMRELFKQDPAEPKKKGK